MLFMGALEKDQDKSKLEQLYIKYARALYLIARSMLHDSASAENATQQTFLFLANHLDKVSDINSKKTGSYLVSIVKNYCRTLLRGKKYQLVNDDIENLEYKISDESVSVEDQVIATDSEERLVALIGTLNESYREAFLLRYCHQMSDEEISEFLGISRNHVSVRINRAKHNLKKCCLRKGALQLGKQLNDDLFEVLLKHAATDYCEQELDALMEQYGGDDRQEEHSEAYRKNMRKLFDRERRRERRLLYAKRSKPLMRAAVIVFACIAGLAAVSLSVDAFRMKIFNLFRSTNPEYTSVLSVEDAGFDKTNIPEGWAQVYLPTKLPRGFYVKNAGSTKHSLMIVYNDDVGNVIKFNQQIATNKGHAWDTQNSELQEIKLDNQTYYAIEKDGQTSIKWYIDSLFFEVTSNLDLESLKPVISSLKIILKKV